MKKSVRLGEIAKIYSGGTPSRIEPAYWGGNIPWVKTTQIQNCVINESDVDEWITEEGLKESSARMVPRGTILMAMYGQGKTRGQVAVLGIDSAINQACVAIEINNNANVAFIFQQLLFRYNEIRSLSNSGSQENLNANLIRRIEIPFPPLTQQTAIANLLSVWDAAIEKTRRLIAKKEKWFKALVQQLILIPWRSKGWNYRRISDIAKRIQRRSNGDNLPILTISSGSGFVLQELKYSRYMAGESVKNYTLLRKGEFAYNKGNSLRYQFGCIFELKEYQEALVPHVYVCFKLNGGIDSDYIRHLFEADYLKRQLGAIVKTGVRNNGLLNIKPDEFMNVTVPVPPYSKQKEIASVLNAAQREIVLLKKQLDAYRRQKRGLMQRLLTGEWHVKIMETSSKWQKN